MQRIANLDVTKNIESDKKVCSLCGTPYEHKQFNPNTRGIWIPACDCEKKKAEQEANIAKLRQARKELRKRYREAGFPPISRGERLRKLTCEHRSEAGVYCSCFKPKGMCGFHYVGTVGSGKTTLAICIGKEMILKGYSVKFMTFAQCIRLLQSTYSSKNPMTFDEQLAELVKTDLLILDDFGREVYKDKALENAFDLFNSIYNNKNNVVLTSNPEMIEKVKKIPDFSAMLDRLHKMAKYRDFKGKSFRRE